MTPITSLTDGRMNTFHGYAKSAAGFVGHERILYLSLVAALERIKGLEKLCCDGEANEMALATELVKLKGDTGETGNESTG